jgi:hypothetical protein
MGIKNAALDADFESVENEVFYFYYCVQRISANTTFFAFFSTYSNLDRIWRFMIQLKILEGLLALFANFEIEFGRNGSKKTKKYSVNVS